VRPITFFQRNQLLVRILTNIKPISTLTPHFLTIDLIFIILFFPISTSLLRFLTNISGIFISDFHTTCHAILTVPAVRKRQRLKSNIHPRTGHESLEGEWRYSATLSLTSALCVGGWSTPHVGRFTPRGKRIFTHSTLCWLGPRVRLDG